VKPPSAITASAMPTKATTSEWFALLPSDPMIRSYTTSNICVSLAPRLKV
jgi:hypothetical protein